MRSSQNYLRWSILLIITVSLMTFIACENQDPMSTNSLEQPSTGKTLTFLKFPKAENSLNKIVTASSWITVASGGHIKLSHKAENPNGGTSSCKISLNVENGSISEDAELSLSLDDADFFIGNFDMVFAPHGIVFSNPALLNIEIKNADFSNLNPDDLNIYYDNPDTGEWELMESDEVIVDASTGYIKIVDGEIPHFSRYAIGTEN